MDSGSAEEALVLVLAPMGRNGTLIANSLGRSGIEARTVAHMAELCAGIDRGIGAAVLTEESLHGRALEDLAAALGRQPTWSDLPLVILTTREESRSAATWEVVKRLEPGGNVSLLERPLRSITLASALQVALRSRRRQYEVRSLYEDLERRVAERTEELQRMNEEAEGFNYSMSHDLRAPLRAIVSTSRLLLEDVGPSLSSMHREMLTRQAQNANKLATLIDDLLALSRISRGQVARARIDMTRLVRDVIDELERASMVGGCAFEVAEDMEAEGDPRLLKLALSNLLGNACKFSPHGGTVRVRRETQDGKAVFVVADEGVGFDMQYVHKLFLPFERLVTESEFPGTGIGLANVERIIHRHGGRVWADGTPGKGATFYFTLG
ncbi:MAG: sensor histidine kinase [Fimbriimonas sp.]